MEQTISLVLLCLLVQARSELQDPHILEPYMFTQEIDGIPKVAIPTSTTSSANGSIVEERYTIWMEVISQKMLPGDFPNTTLYAYSAMTSSGRVSEFPGPAIIAKKDVPVTIRWVNNIQGRHMFKLDYSHPFIDDPIFRNEVPVVPHIHGLESSEISDGLPHHYWTASGSKSEKYRTEQPCSSNQAIYKYLNGQGAGLFWYHDHTFGITRHNVYAGLAGFYQITENATESEPQRAIARELGANITKLYFAIADKSFHTDGSLYYPDTADSQLFTTWVPEFYGNTMTVNGKVWPKVKLDKKIYRMVFLNACNSRFLNIFFLYLGQKLPFQIIRLEGDYHSQSVIANEVLLSPSTRIEIIIDLTKVYGEVLLKNDAQSPFPNGDPVDKFTGTIMKITTNQFVVDKTSSWWGPIRIKSDGQSSAGSLLMQPIQLKQDSVYPAFGQGEPRNFVLNEVEDSEGMIAGMFINGISMHVGETAPTTFQLGRVYDLSITNLTPDTHPIHFHLVNFQVVSRYPINVNDYTRDWQMRNGACPVTGYNSPPAILDPILYKSGSAVPPQPHEKVFRDVTEVPPDMVTVLRIKLSKNDGAPFGINMTGSCFVWHCHILEHEDCQMMAQFCVQ